MRPALLVALGLVGTLLATNSQAQWEDTKVYQLHKFTQPPVLDGNRATVSDEWANTLELECSPEVVLADGAEYGWRDAELHVGNISANQLNQSAGEDGTIARTSDDLSSVIWHAWDEDAFYFFTEVRDNVRDVVGGGGDPTAWWERDSLTLILDLLNEDVGGAAFGERNNQNWINYVAAPQNSSAVTRTLGVTVQTAIENTQDEDLLEGLEYGFRDAGDEFGGEADYAIEGKISWETLVRGGNLPRAPSVGEEMGFSWIPVDPDNDEAYGGQLQCEGFIPNQATYSTWIFSDTPAGPGSSSATAVEEDSWARIKASFAQ